MKPRMHLLFPESKQRQKQSGGFTVLELIVAMAIVAVLAVFLFSASQKARPSAIRVKCTQNLKQIYTGAQLYAGDNNAALPVIADIAQGRTVYKSGLIDRLEAYIPDKHVFYCPDAGAAASIKTYEYQSKNTDPMPFWSIGYYWMISTSPSWLSGATFPQKTSGSGKRVLGSCIHFDVEPHTGRMNFLFADGHVEILPGKRVNQIVPSTLMFP